MHPTLLVGPYDWDPERFPKKEFTDRIEVFWQQISDASCSTAIVYGDSRNHAELAYLSNFVPKLGPALMLIPREGEPTLLVSGAPNMSPAAQRLTWIEKIQPLQDAGRTVIHWMTGSSGSVGRHAVLVAGEYMRSALHRSLSEGFGSENRPADATSSLRTLMRRKRPRELAAIREACAILNAATKTLAEAKSSGASVTTAVLEAERTAYQSGAQDVRTLFSVDGGQTLRPFEVPINHAVDPLQAYIAVCNAGYWGEGFVALAASKDPALTKATDGLKAATQIATPGIKSCDLVRVAAEGIKPYGFHAMTAANVGNSIGLSLEEAPLLWADGEEELEAGSVYTLRVGVSDGREHHAFASAMIYVHHDGNEVLWSAI